MAEVREFVAMLPVTHAQLDDQGPAALLRLAEQDARERLAEQGPHTVLSVTHEWVDPLPGHTLAGFAPDTGEPIGPTGRTIVTRLRVVEADR